MMNVSLVPLTSDNYLAAIELRVYPEQERFVGTVAEAIAAAYFNRNLVKRAIVNAERTMVGFLVFELNSAGTYRLGGITLHRFLIKCTEQGKGYGLAALEALKQLLRTAYPVVPLQVELRTDPENLDAIRLYKRAGFQMNLIPTDDGPRQQGTLALT
jgi:diamine N-acetyltransferase